MIESDIKFQHKHNFPGTVLNMSTKNFSNDSYDQKKKFEIDTLILNLDFLKRYKNNHIF
jgi:hypothetical protein